MDTEIKRVPRLSEKKAKQLEDARRSNVLKGKKKKASKLTEDELLMQFIRQELDKSKHESESEVSESEPPESEPESEPPESEPSEISESDETTSNNRSEYEIEPVQQFKQPKHKQPRLRLPLDGRQPQRGQIKPRKVMKQSFKPQLYYPPQQQYSQPIPQQPEDLRSKDLKSGAFPVYQAPKVQQPRMNNRQILGLIQDQEAKSAPSLNIFRQ